MTKKGSRHTAGGGGGGNAGARRSGGATGGDGAKNYFSALMGAGGGGDSMIDSSHAAAESMGFPLGAMGGGAAPPPELLAQMFGGGAAEAAFGPAAAAAVAQDDGVDKSRWHILYPAYLDKKKTVAGGRRVPLGIAVQDPKVEEMKKICDHLRIPAAIEYVDMAALKSGVEDLEKSQHLHFSRVCTYWKRYPRDWLFCRGRLRVQFKDTSDQSLYNSEVPNKKALMRRMCELIPQLKSRSAAGGASGGGAASSASSGKKKKK